MSKVDNNGGFWKNVRFFMLFLICVLSLYIIQTKFLIGIPKANTELLESIKDLEKVLEDEQKFAKEVSSVNEQIDTIKFDIHQVQKQDEIINDINSMPSIYIEQNRDYKFFYSVMMSKILLIKYDIKEQISSLKRNQELIDMNLSECKANL